jgi:hypothetical protein
VLDIICYPRLEATGGEAYPIDHSGFHRSEPSSAIPVRMVLSYRRPFSYQYLVMAVVMEAVSLACRDSPYAESRSLSPSWSISSWLGCDAALPGIEFGSSPGVGSGAGTGR